MSIPVSVLVAHRPSRKEFFLGFCLPSIERNNPAEILIDDGPGGGAAARNRLARRAVLKYILFADDDDIFRADAFASLVNALESRPECSFAYGDMVKVTMPGVPDHGWQPVHIHRARPFDLEELKRENYIDTPALIRRQAFPGIDESPAIARLHDWDLWLRMALAGHRGLYVPGILYHSWNLDDGLSAVNSLGPAIKAVLRKNGLKR